MCVHHTKNYLEFKARGGAVSGWIGKSGSGEGGNRPDQEGQQKHQSKEKLDCAHGRLLEFYLLHT